METSVFKFIALSDTHITATRTSLRGKVSDLIVDAIVKYHKDAAFIVNCGDLSNDNFKETGGIKRESYIYNDIWYTKAMRVGLPHYYDGFGNHDIFVGKAPANNDDMRVFLTKKNKKRKANGEITALCDKNMNYEWQIKKGDITFHFIMLNLFPKAPVSKATE